ncbi:hypothetical protein Krac_5661 [Ktedonobacter racemifer DSM 44963]|uniref:Uncharacterized protein n=1 Tax=Ktedonobacter racemifer DSM 44963 TaxID=485913 RepID=D6TWK2_KTERA|nr:hypothetical protein Krac_5661 [Ktedonobacter racemifer DSM 44963]
MSISTLYRCMRSLEAIKNYAIAVDWNASSRALKPGSQEGLFERSLSPESSRCSRNSLHRANTRYYRFYDDCQFWSIIFTSSFEEVDGCDVNFSACALSEWVARIPGLF